MKIRINGIFLVLMIFVFILLSSCTAVKEYQKVYLNDENMKLSSSPATRFETKFQIYREGASGASGGQTGGGCGCN